jgi:integrase
MLFTTLLETGGRYMEIATLTPAQLGTDSIRIEPHFLPDGSWWRPKRPASTRSTIVSCDMLEALREAARGLPEHALIWWPEKESPTQSRTANYYLRKHCLRLNLPVFSTHQLRRVRITQSLAAGADPNTVRAAVGHRSLITTVRYMQDVPVRGVLPSLDAEPAKDPVVSQYMFMARNKNWSTA